VVLLALLGAIAGYGFARLATPTYVGRAYVAAVARGTGNDQSAVNYAGAYAKIAVQSEVMNAAARASGGRFTPDELRTHVRTSTSPDAPVIEIAGSAGNAQHAADLANQVAAGLITIAARTGDQTRIDCVLLSRADPPAGPAAPRAMLDVAVGAAAGALLGGLLMLSGLGRRPARRRPVRSTGVGPPEHAVDPTLRSKTTHPAGHRTMAGQQIPSGPPGGAGRPTDNRGG
jgi:capsular polysaccharide biosynthesis protein